MMSNFTERGYIVKETGTVYYSKDMNKTLAWFMDVLGWYGKIKTRNEENRETYGCVNNIPIKMKFLLRILRACICSVENRSKEWLALCW